MINGKQLAALANISARSLSRWERHAGLRPRDGEVRKLIAAIATLDHPAAVDLAALLELSPPDDPRPPPPSAIISSSPAIPPAPPPPPPVPTELAIDPVEAAVFRAAEALGVTPTPLRPVLARFLGHIAALGITAAEAQLRLG